MQKDFNNIPLAESNVSLKLADIQQRCTELLKESGDSLELSLEDPIIAIDDNNPSSRG